MRLSLKGLVITSALLGGGCILCVGLTNLAAPSYGTAFLQLASSVYPGFRNLHTFVDVLVGTVYGLVDGALAGLFFGLLYNFFAGQPSQS